jgi:hypothetical protein
MCTNLGGTGSAGGSIDPSTGAYTPPASVPSGTTPSDIIHASATVGGYGKVDGMKAIYGYY